MVRKTKTPQKTNLVNDRLNDSFNVARVSQSVVASVSRSNLYIISRLYSDIAYTERPFFFMSAAPSPSRLFERKDTRRPVSVRSVAFFCPPPMLFWALLAFFLATVGSILSFNVLVILIVCVIFLFRHQDNTGFRLSSSSAFHFR